MSASCLPLSWRAGTEIADNYNMAWTWSFHRSDFRIFTAVLIFVTVFASTSFAQDRRIPAEDAAAKIARGATSDDGQGGRSKSKWGSCAAGAKSSPKRLLDGDGFKEWNDAGGFYKVGIGPYGPQLEIGDTTVFLDPTSTTEDPTPQAGSPPMKPEDIKKQRLSSYSWCVKNPTIKKQDGADAKEFNCNLYTGTDGKPPKIKKAKDGSETETLPIKAKSGGAQVEVQLVRTRDKDGNVTDVYLQVFGSDKGEDRYLRVDLDYKNKDKTIDGKFNVAVINGKTQARTGAHIERFRGTLDDGPKAADSGATKLAKCASLLEGEGTVNKTETSGSEEIRRGLEGTCYYGRGKVVGLVGERKEDCNVDASARVDQQIQSRLIKGKK